MLSLSPRKQVLKARLEIPQLQPEYKREFTHVPGMPESLVVLCENNMLLHLHTNQTEADSVLCLRGSTQVPQPVQVQSIPLPELRKQPEAEEGHTQWLTVLEVDPKLNVYAVLSTTGTLVFFKLRLRVQRDQESYVAKVFKQSRLGENKYYKRGASYCLNGNRFFMTETRDRGLEVWCCDVTTYDTTFEFQHVDFILRLVHEDYNTENNILGCKHNVLYYNGEVIATVPRGYTIVTWFGTQCNAFQLLVKRTDATPGLEWWRWTGEECEAVVLSNVESVVPKGNLVWF